MEIERDFGKTINIKESGSFEALESSKDFLVIKSRMSSFLNELKKRAENFKEA